MTSPVRTFSGNMELVERRRAEIVRVASKLFIKNGYAQTGMRELAKAFGKSTGSLYHYVGSKQDVLSLIIDFTVTHQEQYLQTIRSKVAGLSPTEALTQAIRIYLRSLDRYAEMYVFVNHVVVTLQKQDRKKLFDCVLELLSFFEEILVEGVACGEFKPHDTFVMAHNIAFTGHAWTTRRQYWRGYSLRKYITRQTELALSSIAASGTEDNKYKSR